MDDLYRIQVRECREYAMFTMDAEGILTSWNAGVEELFGYSEAEWIGQHASIIFTPADVAVEVCASEMKKAGEEGTASDIRWHRRKNHLEFFGTGVLRAVRNDAGELTGYAKILSDETARKKLQDSLTESNAALEQFAFVASHDLQEPLRTISAYTQLLTQRYRGKFDSEADQFLEFIAAASTRMGNLVRDLLSYARLTTEMERPDSVALDDDIEAALSHLAQAIDESGATVTHDPLPILKADRGQMVRLFQNLVGNAVKYRRREEPPRVHVTAQERNGEWVFSVRDNGIGFDPKFASTIFAPFKRLHTSAAYEGTGVGLAICRRIVQRHGGRIWAESEPGVASTIYFTLPV